MDNFIGIVLSRRHILNCFKIELYFRKDLDLNPILSFGRLHRKIQADSLNVVTNGALTSVFLKWMSQERHKVSFTMEYLSFEM